MSILFCKCESWTLMADLERRIQAFENKCYRRMLVVSYRQHKTNEYVWQQVSILAGCHALLLTTVRRRKLSWFGHVCRHDTPPKMSQTKSVNHGRTPSNNGQASHCRHCCASLMTEADGQSSLEMHLSGHPIDAWASRVLVS